MSPTRNILADVLKGVAVVLMIQVHVLELFAPSALHSTPWGQLSLFLGGPFAAPLFLSAMGYFLERSESSNRTLLKRGAALLTGGLLLNIGLNATLLSRIHTGAIELSPWPYVFGVDILFCAGLSLWFTAALHALLPRRAWVYACAIALTLIASEMLAAQSLCDGVTAYGCAFFGGAYRWSYFPLAPWLVYPLTGLLLHRLLHQERVELSRPQGRSLMAIALCYLALDAALGWRTATELPRYYHHDGRFYLWTVALLWAWLALWRSALQHLPGVLLEPLRRLGQFVTVAYVCQWLLLGNLATLWYQSLTPQQLILVFGAALAITYACVLLWERRAEARLQAVGCSP